MQPQDQIVSEIFSYVAEFWPLMTRKPSTEHSEAVAGESSAPEPSDDDEFNGEFADAMVLQLGLRDDGYPADDMEDDPMNDISGPVNMAQPVEPPHDSQVLDDRYPCPISLSPPKLDALEYGGVCPSGPGSPEVRLPSDGPSSPAPAPASPQPVAVDSYSPSIAPTEPEVTPSPNPVHTSENKNVEMIEIEESPEPKKDPMTDEEYQRIRDRINVLKYLVCILSSGLR